VDAVSKAGDSLGQGSLHYWADKNFAFVVQQEVKGLKDGKYTVAVSTQGGGGQSKYELFIIGDNGEKKTAAIADTGWNKWQTVEIKDVTVKNGKAVIGVEMQANAGNWGSMDNFEFYLQQ
jgi:arabinogalactan endo-1,4-beta-galactosidase